MKILKVKSILFSLMAMMAVTVFMTSCGQQDIVNEQQLDSEVYPETDVQPDFVKTLKIYDESGEGYVKMSVTAKYGHLNEGDLTITPKKVDESDYSSIANFDRGDDVDGKIEASPADFYIEEIVLPEGFNSLSFKLNDEGLLDSRGCKDPRTFQFDGACGRYSSGQRVFGFRGKPINCAHTDWEWKRKKGWGWSKQFDKDSYSSSTYIHFQSSEVHSAYQLRIDPNDSCCFYPSYSNFTIYLTSGDC